MKNHILDYDPKWNNSVLAEDTGTAAPVDPAVTNPETGKAWTFIEKMLGYADKAVDTYNKAKSGATSSTGVSFGGSSNIQPAPEETFLGMPKMVGIGVTVGVVALVGFAIWKMNK